MSKSKRINRKVKRNSEDLETLYEISRKSSYHK